MFFLSKSIESAVYFIVIFLFFLALEYPPYCEIKNNSLKNLVKYKVDKENALSQEIENGV